MLLRVLPEFYGKQNGNFNLACTVCMYVCMYVMYVFMYVRTYVCTAITTYTSRATCSTEAAY